MCDFREMSIVPTCRTKKYIGSKQLIRITVVLLVFGLVTGLWRASGSFAAGEGNKPSQQTDGKPATASASAEKTFMLPDEEPVDWSAYPQGLGVLGQHHLMHPVDMGDWPIDIGSRRQLFIDGHVVHSINGLKREFHQPTSHPNNPIFKPEKAWEKTGNEGFGVDLGTVLRDLQTGKYRMWYSVKGFGEDVRDKSDNNYHFYRPMCYAESEDGILWTRPATKIYTFKDYPDDNNIIHWRNTGRVFVDPKETDPAHKFKALFYHRRPNFFVEGLYLYSSADGIRWKRLSDRWVMPIVEKNRTEQFQAGFRSQGKPHRLPENGVNNATVYYDEVLDKYVADVKYALGHVQSVARAESDDLIHWTNPRFALYQDGIDEGDGLYYMYTFPYESVWLGMVRAEKSQKHKTVPWKQVNVQLAISHDGRNWSRTANRQELIPLGDPDSWDADYNRVPCAPILLDDEIRFYYSGSRNMERDNLANFQFAIGLATLRRDGFVSLNAGEKPGRVLTRPLAYEGNRLFVNADVEEVGYLKVRVRDMDGEKLADYDFDDCVPMTKDSHREPIAWKSHATLPAASRRKVHNHFRFEFELKNAKLYSFWIE